MYLLKLQYDAGQQDGVVRLKALIECCDFLFTFGSELAIPFVERRLECLKLFFLLLRLFPDIQLLVETLRRSLLFAQFLDFRIHFLVLHDKLFVLDAYPVLNLALVVLAHGLCLLVQLVQHLSDEMLTYFLEQCIFLILRRELAQI